MFPFEDLITKHILQYFAELNPGQMMMFTYHQERKFFWNLPHSSSQNFAVTTYNRINSVAKEFTLESNGTDMS